MVRFCTREIDRSKRLLGGDDMPASNVYFNLQVTFVLLCMAMILRAELASSTNKSCAADSWIRWWWWQCRWWLFFPAKDDNDDDDGEFDKQNFEEPLLLFLTVESTYQQRQGVTPQNALHLTPFHFQSFKVSKIDSKYVSLVLTGPLGLPQVFNQALRRQCACVGFVQSGTVS